MAGVAKWLRPRIVVPIFVGSNPITRPIFKRPLYGVFFRNYGKIMFFKRLLEKLNQQDFVIYRFNIALFLRTLTLLSPIILFFYNEHGLETKDLFFCQGIFLVFAILFDVLIGYLSNNKSRKYLLISSFVIYFIATLLWLFFKGYYIILIGEILYAISKTAMDNITPSYLYDYCKTKNKSVEEYIGNATFFTFFGTTLSSLLGAFLYLHFNSSFILILECILITLAIILMTSIPNIENNNSKENNYSIKEYLKTTKSIFKNRPISYYIFYSGLLQAFSILFVLCFQPLMRNSLFPIIFFGIITFINQFIRSFASIIAGKYFKKVSIKKLTTPLFLLYAFAFGLIFVINQNTNIVLNFTLITLICIIIGAQTIFMVLHMSRIQKLAPLNQKGSLMTVNNIIARLLPALILISARMFLNSKDLTLFFLSMFSIFTVTGFISVKKLQKLED